MCLLIELFEDTLCIVLFLVSEGTWVTELLLRVEGTSCVTLDPGVNDPSGVKLDL